MTRIQSLASRPKRTLGALAVVLAAVGITVGSGANFSASKANAGTFAAGKLSIGNQLNKSVFAGLDMIPGTSDIGTVDVTNTGTVGGLFYLSQTVAPAVNPEDTVLLDKLNLTILDCGDAATPNCTTPLRTVYNGPMKSFPSSGKALVNLDGYTGPALWAKGESHHFQFTVNFPDAGGSDGSDDGAQGGKVAATYTWKATSS